MASSQAPAAGSAPAGGGGDRGYKRSWKNLLINKRYQLRFTLFMVGLSAVLMVGLGLWVMKVANETTTVGVAGVRGELCPPVPKLGSDADAVAPDDDDTPPPHVPMALPPDGGSASGSGSGSASGSGSGSAAPAAEPERHHAHVVLDESSMTLSPKPVEPAKPLVPASFKDSVIKHWTCQLRQTSTIDNLYLGRLRILLVMAATGIALIFGLAIYGIKMTHKVAGPLFKVTLYLNKMRDGRFDRVWNLRKGDQLVDFYENFKGAHAGVVQLERDDIARVRALIAAADKAGAGDSDVINELRALLLRKEKSLE